MKPEFYTSFPLCLDRFNVVFSVDSPMDCWRDIRKILNFWEEPSTKRYSINQHSENKHSDMNAQGHLG